MNSSYYKGKGPSGIVKAAHAVNTVNNSGGQGGESVVQKPIPGPESPGLPISMRKALTKKDNTGKGPGLPSKSTSFAGSVR